MLQCSPKSARSKSLTTPEHHAIYPPRVKMWMKQSAKRPLSSLSIALQCPQVLPDRLGGNPKKTIRARCSGSPHPHCCKLGATKRSCYPSRGSHTGTRHRRPRQGVGTSLTRSSFKTRNVVRKTKTTSSSGAQSTMKSLLTPFGRLTPARALLIAASAPM
jgi:hypothetical protein